MPFFSLPGPFDGGVFGKEALEFAGQLHLAGFREWLTLPFSPPGAFYSPYAAHSSFAGSKLFIDPRKLVEKGLLLPGELLFSSSSPQRVDYESWESKQDYMLGLAFTRLQEKDKEDIRYFLEKEAYWLRDYAAYMSIHKKYGHLAWWDWPNKALAACDKEEVARFVQENQSLFNYFCFEQFIFHNQWLELKKEINALGLSIIGDLPIYPAADSSDLWANRNFFETDEEGNITRVAGVPPDYFSPTGQLWGNPLYDWKALKEDHYDYWVRRLGKSLELYDKVRLDHFIGFKSYWAVPYGERTAVNGTWEKGPGMDLFNKFFSLYPREAIIAEDLGVITDDTGKFIKESGLPGMKILLFAFNAHDNKTSNRPHSYGKNTVAFTGTHDNDTLIGFIKAMNNEDWALFSSYLDLPITARADGHDMSIVRRAIIALFNSPANTVIIPVQDLLACDNRYRINLPGTVGDHNWTIRFTAEELSRIDTGLLARALYASQRS